VAEFRDGASKIESSFVTAHSPALDGLRGIAILLVLAHHLTVVRPGTEFETAVFGLMHMGWAGVDLFFVLSGFLITGILLDSRGSNRYFTSFYARRTLRIFPLYYLVIFVSYHVLPYFPTWYGNLVGTGQVPPEHVFWLFVSNFTFAERNEFSHGILGVSWSLAIEEQFYLVWAAVVWLISPAWFGGLCAALIAAAPVLRAMAIEDGAREIEVYVTTMYRADALAAGGGLAWLARRPAAPPIHQYGPWAVLVGVAGVVTLSCWDGHLSWDGGIKQVVGYTFLALAASGLLLCATNPNERARGPRWMSARWLQMFGRYSFCLYLIHLPVMWAVRYSIFDPTRAPRVLDSAMPAQILFWILTLASAFVLAALSWRLFERPILGLKRFFPY
jgi:peptidoglycan/LPS O-acetylase OafA/YrhL